MKRFFILFCILFLSLFCVYSQNLDVSSSDSEESVAQLQKDQKKKAKELKKALEKQEKEKQRFMTDPYLGISYTEENKVNYKKDTLGVYLNKKSDFFNIYIYPVETRAVSLLAPGDSDSFISVMWNKTEYKLNQKHRVEKQIRKLDDGCQLSYTVKNKFQTVVDFKIMSSKIGGRCDIVKVSLYLINLSGKKANASVRLCLNTSLGENQNSHFSSDEFEKITQECQITDFTANQIINLGSESVSVQMLLNGKNFITPQAVTIANKNILAKSRWLPEIDENRNFNDIYALNDSAVCINWPKKTVGENETVMIPLYFAAATDGDEACGKEYLALLEDVNENYVQYDLSDKKELVVNTVNVTDVDFVVEKKEQNTLDPEYVQNLINRIEALQSDPRYVDRVQVRQLNEELDSILLKIRQQ